MKYELSFIQGETKMNEKLENFLCKEYTILYKQRNLPMNQTCMCWGFECQNGWYDIINELSYELEEINKTLVAKGLPPIEAEQVKEKFGGLRYYTNGVPYIGIKEKIAQKFNSILRKTFFSKLGQKIPYNWKICNILTFNNELKVYKFINKAEEKASVTCEICGSTGKTRWDLGWVQTLCIEHYLEILDKKK